MHLAAMLNYRLEVKSLNSVLMCLSKYRAKTHEGLRLKPRNPLAVVAMGWSISLTIMLDCDIVLKR